MADYSVIKSEKGIYTLGSHAGYPKINVKLPSGWNITTFMDAFNDVLLKSFSFRSMIEAHGQKTDAIDIYYLKQAESSGFFVDFRKNSRWSASGEKFQDNGQSFWNVDSSGNYANDPAYSTDAYVFVNADRIKGATKADLEKSIFETIAHELYHPFSGVHSWDAAGRMYPTLAEVMSDPAYEMMGRVSLEAGFAANVGTNYYVAVGHPAAKDANGNNLALGAVNGNGAIVVSYEDALQLYKQAIYNAFEAKRKANGHSVNETTTSGGANLEVSLMSPDGEKTSIALPKSDASKIKRASAFSAVGSIVGSTLGNYLAGGNAVKGVLYSSVLGEIGERLGFAVAGGPVGRDLSSLTSKSISSSFATDVWQRLTGASVGTVSSMLAGQLAQSMGLQGFGGELFSTVASTGLNAVVAEVIKNLSDGNIYTGAFNGVFTSGVLNSALFATSIGSFIGAKLGALIVKPETEAAAALSSIGAAVGAFGASSAVLGMAAIFETSPTFMGLMTATGIGAVVGFVLGALIGNLFGRKKPKLPQASAETVLQVPYARYEVGTITVNADGSREVVTAMAAGARDILNGFIGNITGGRESALVANLNGVGTTQIYGHSGSQLYVKINGTQKNVNSAEEAVEFGVLAAIRNTKVIGGELFIKRAIANSVGQDLVSFSGDIQTARDYRFYLRNRDAINKQFVLAYATLSEADKQFYSGANKDIVDAIVSGGVKMLTAAQASTYNSNKALFDRVVISVGAQGVANSWLVTLTRADELKLNQTSTTDFYGGLKGFVDGWSLTYDRSVAYEDLTPRLSTYSNQFTGSGVNVFQSWWDGETGKPYTFTKGQKFGRDSFIVSKQITPGQIDYWGWGTYAGGFAMFGAGAGDNFWSVQAGQTIVASFDAHALGGETDVNVSIAFWDANFNSIGEVGERYMNMVDWTHVGTVAKAPVGAAYAAISVGVRSGGNTTQVIEHGLAINAPSLIITNDDGQRYFDLSPAPGVQQSVLELRRTLKGDGTNRMRGSEGELGLSVLTSYWDAGVYQGTNAGDHLRVRLEGEGADKRFVVSKPKSDLYSNGDVSAGSVALLGGDSKEGRWSVAAGQTYGYAFDAQQMATANYVEASINFYDAAGVRIAREGWSGSYVTSNWTRLSGKATAPAGAVTALIEIGVYATGSGDVRNSELSVALRRPQFNSLASASSAVPSYSPFEGSQEVVAEATDFLSKSGFIQSANPTGGNDYIDKSASGSGVMVLSSNGEDIIVGSQFNDQLGSSGSSSGSDWIDGQGGNDNITGGDANDVLLGGAGIDYIKGGNGDDYLSGGDGDDLGTLGGGLFGGEGNDTLVGGAGSDALYGEAGNDLLIIDQDGGNVYDALMGGAGSDTASFERFEKATSGEFTAIVDMRNLDDEGVLYVYGDAWSQIENVTGSNHRDYLVGDNGSNVLRGLDGNDYIHAWYGNDVVEGGAGADEMYGGADIDVLSYEHSNGGVYIDLSTGKALGADAEGDKYYEFENIRGSKYADRLKGDAGSNTIEGLAGDDWIVATAGGTASYSYVYNYYWDEPMEVVTWTGGDVYNGGIGFDTVDYSEATSGITAYLGSYTETTSYNGSGSAGMAQGASYINIEAIVGSQYADTLTAGAGAQTLEGGKGNDTLSGGDGADTYIYGIGDGEDTIINENNGASNVVSLGANIAWRDLWSGGTNGSNGYLDIGVFGASGRIRMNSNFTVRNRNYVRILDMNGASQMDLYQFDFHRGGTNNNDVINGSNAYADWIFGNNGDDTMTGSAGASEGNGNIFIGGYGNDTMSASMGDDQYAYDRGDGADTITDSGGEDTILFGQTVAAEDVIYQVLGNDLYIGLKESSSSTLTASQVSSRIRVVNGGVIYETRYGNEGTYSVQSRTHNTIEFVQVGGTSIDLRKLDINWKLQVTWNYNPYMPIVLDLDNSGLDLSAVDSSDIVVRTNKGGLSRIAWAGPTDAFLAVDRDGDGSINKLSEISFTQDKEGATSDLEGLKTWDTNGDGLLDAKDANFNKLLVFQDLNQNGRSSQKELRTLAGAGIAAIDLNGVATGNNASMGIDSFVQHNMKFIWADGTTGNAFDVALARRVLGSDGLYAGDYQEEWGAFDEDGELGRLLNDPKTAAKASRVGQRKALMETLGASYQEVKDHARVDFTDHDRVDATVMKRWEKLDASEKAAWLSGQLETGPEERAKTVSADQALYATYLTAENATKALQTSAYDAAGATVNAGGTTANATRGSRHAQSSTQTAVSATSAGLGVAVAASEPIADIASGDTTTQVQPQPWWRQASEQAMGSGASLGGLLTAMQQNHTGSGGNPAFMQQQALLRQAMAGFGGETGGSAAVWSRDASGAAQLVAASAGIQGTASSAATPFPRG